MWQFKMLFELSPIFVVDTKTNFMLREFFYIKKKKKKKKKRKKSEKFTFGRIFLYSGKFFMVRKKTISKTAVRRCS